MTAADEAGRLILASENDGVLAALLGDAVRSDMTAEQAAKACHALLKRVAKAAGQDPDVETFIRAPGQPRHYADAQCWCVAWEAGPHDWAIPASMVITRRSGRLAEAYYGFDLMFYPTEWAA